MTTTTPVQRGTATSAAGSPSAAPGSVTLAKPTGLIAGDLVVVIGVSQDGATPANLSMNSGGGTWTKLGGGQQNGAFGAAAVFWKIVASAGEPADYVFSYNGNGGAAVCVAFQWGTFDPANPFPAGSYAYAINASTSGTKTAPVATGIAQGVAVEAFSDVGILTTVTNPSWGSYTGSPTLAEVADAPGAGTWDATLGVALATLVGGGNTTAYTAVSTNAARRAITAAAVVQPSVSQNFAPTIAADAAGAVDSVTASRGFPRTLTDTAGAVDSVTASRGYPRAPTDTAGVADAGVTKVVTAARLIADTAHAGDSVTYELKHADLRDWEFAVDAEPYIPIGRFQTIALESFDPGVVDFRTQDQLGASGDYVTFGRDYKSPPVWGFGLYTNCESPEEALGWADMLGRVWDAADTRDTPDAVVALRYRVAGRVRRVYGRPRGFDPADTTLLQNGRLPIAAQFALAEPIYYDDDETIVAQIPPDVDDDAVGTGFTWPVVWPVIMGRPEQIREEQFIVGGSRPTWLTLRFHGPSTNPWVIIGDRYAYALRGSIQAGMNVEISGLPWMRHVLRSDGVYVPGMLHPRARLSQLRVKPGIYSIQRGGVGHTSQAVVEVACHNAWHMF